MTKKRTTQKIREANRNIISEIINKGKQTTRKLGEPIGRSKSSTHCHTQAIKQPNQHPQIFAMGNRTGKCLVRLMVFAVLYFFGLKSGVGANTLSLFFRMTGIDTHVGVSVSALRKQLNQMETLLPTFQALCEK